MSDAVLIAIIGAVASIGASLVSLFVLLGVNQVLGHLKENRDAIAKTHDLVDGALSTLEAARTTERQALVDAAAAHGFTEGEQAQRVRASEPQP